MATCDSFVYIEDQHNFVRQPNLTKFKLKKLSTNNDIAQSVKENIDDMTVLAGVKVETSSTPNVDNPLPVQFSMREPIGIDTLLLTYKIHDTDVGELQSKCTKPGGDFQSGSLSNTRLAENVQTKEKCKSIMDADWTVKGVVWNESTKECKYTTSAKSIPKKSSDEEFLTFFSDQLKLNHVLPWELDANDCRKCSHVLDTESQCRLDLGLMLPDAAETTLAMAHILKKTPITKIGDHVYSVHAYDPKFKQRNSLSVLKSVFPRQGTMPEKQKSIWAPMPYFTNSDTNMRFGVYEQRPTRSDYLEAFSDKRIAGRTFTTGDEGGEFSTRSVNFQSRARVQGADHVRLATTSTCRLECDQNDQCKAFAVDQFGVSCTLYREAVAPRISRLPNRILYTKISTYKRPPFGQRNDFDEARFVPRAKCAEDRTRNFSHVHVEHDGVTYTASCPIGTGYKEEPLVNSSGRTVQTDTGVDFFSDPDEICGLSGFAKSAEEAKLLPLSSNAPNFMTCPRIHSRKSMDNVFELPDGRRLHVNCRAQRPGLGADVPINRGDRERDGAYRHFQLRTKSFTKPAVDPSQVFVPAGMGWYGFGDNKAATAPPSDEEMVAHLRATAAAASMTALATSLTQVGDPKRAFFENTDLCSPGGDADFDDFGLLKENTSSVRGTGRPAEFNMTSIGEKMFKMNNLSDWARATLEGANTKNQLKNRDGSIGMFEDKARDRMCQCNQAFYRMGWYPGWKNKGLNLGVGKFRLGSAANRIRFVENALECWMPDDTRVLSAGSMDDAWPDYVKRTDNISRAKVVRGRFARNKISRAKVEPTESMKTFHEKDLSSSGAVKLDDDISYEFASIVRRTFGDGCPSLMTAPGQPGDTPLSDMFLCRAKKVKKGEGADVVNLSAPLVMIANERDEEANSFQFKVLNALNDATRSVKNPGITIDPAFAWKAKLVQEGRTGVERIGWNRTPKFMRRLYNPVAGGKVGPHAAEIDKYRSHLPFFGKRRKPITVNENGTLVLGSVNGKDATANKTQLFLPWDDVDGVEKSGRSRVDMLFDSSGLFFDNLVKYVTKNESTGKRCGGGLGMPSFCCPIPGNKCQSGEVEYYESEGGVDTSQRETAINDSVQKPIDPFTGKVLFDLSSFKGSPIEVDYCAFVPKSTVTYRAYKNKEVQAECDDVDGRLRLDRSVDVDRVYTDAGLGKPSRVRAGITKADGIEDASQKCEQMRRSDQADCVGFAIDPDCTQDCDVAFVETMEDAMPRNRQQDSSAGHRLFLGTAAKTNLSGAKSFCQDDSQCGGFSFDDENGTASFFKLFFPRTKRVTESLKSPLDTCLKPSKTRTFFEVISEKSGVPRLFSDARCRRKLEKAGENSKNFSDWVTDVPEGVGVRESIASSMERHCMSYTRKPNMKIGDWDQINDQDRSTARARCTSKQKTTCENDDNCQYFEANTKMNPSDTGFCDLRRTINFKNMDIAESSSSNACQLFKSNDPGGVITDEWINRFRRADNYGDMRESRCSESYIAQHFTDESQSVVQAGPAYCAWKSCTDPKEGLRTRKMDEDISNCQVNVCVQNLNISGNVSFIGSGNSINFTASCGQGYQKKIEPKNCGKPWQDYLDHVASTGEEDPQKRKAAIEQCAKKIDDEFRAANDIPADCPTAINLPESQWKGSSGVDSGGANNYCEGTGAWEACVLDDAPDHCKRYDWRKTCKTLIESIKQMSTTKNQIRDACSSEPGSQCGSSTTCRVKGEKIPCMNKLPESEGGLVRATKNNVAFACYDGIPHPIGVDAAGFGVCLDVENRGNCGDGGETTCSEQLERATDETAHLRCASSAGSGRDVHALNHRFDNVGWCSQLMHKHPQGKTKLSNELKSFFDKISSDCECSSSFENVDVDFCERLEDRVDDPKDVINDLVEKLGAYKDKFALKSNKCVSINSAIDQQRRIIDFDFTSGGEPCCFDENLSCGDNSVSGTTGDSSGIAGGGSASGGGSGGSSSSSSSTKEETDETKDESGNFFTKKAGGLPVWAWFTIGGVSLIAIIIGLVFALKK